MLITESYIKEQYEIEKEKLIENPYKCKLLKEENGKKIYSLGHLFWKCMIIVSNDDGKWHLSISRRNRKPSARQAFIARWELLPSYIELVEIEGLYATHLIESKQEVVITRYAGKEEHIDEQS
ncbi:hypothetical protein IAI10_16715 [Clostridium sp. 19966]|uniref:hypothetical protein n=1 Tax=Clostridium sp. 19966 TaxID=2768166 RepID=UPI0028DD4EB1|nr:hypothetical protein [Clostridium sp. 19966]MDT8718312.1 hypothetical protein [Clostridium sp. 19966]